MMGGTVDIGWLELACASLFMSVAAFVSWKLELGQTRRIAVATVRCFLQLLAMGLVLQFVFANQTWWMVCGLIAVMLGAATQIATSRVKSEVPGLRASVFVSLLTSSLAVAAVVVEGVLHADPWYNATQAVPLCGMIVSNAMTAIAVAVDRLFADMDARADEMFTLVALGASPYEAARPSLVASIGAGLTPLLASMSAAGIVALPGMMSGQILAGADPLVAAKYQVVVLLMISASNIVAIVLACFLLYRKRFARAGYYLEPGLRARDVQGSGRGPRRSRLAAGRPKSAAG